MICNPHIGMDGRLGNQLFQYAAVKGIGLKLGYDVTLSDQINSFKWHGQNNLLTEFNVESEVRQLEPGMFKLMYIEPDHMEFDPNVSSLPDNTLLKGYFQSIKYWEGYEDIIKRELTPKKHYLDSAKKYIDSLRIDDRPIISLHLRRGDNTDGSNPSKELNTMYDRGGFWEQYFTKASESFDFDFRFLVFTGGSRGEGNDNSVDIEWAKNNLKGEFLFSEGGDAFQDFCRIMMCDHHVLSHISSFGWWAAYLDKKDCVTIAPKHYHPDIPEFTHREGFYPDDWRII